MDDPPDSIQNNSGSRHRNSFIKFDGSLSKSFKSKAISRENSYNESTNKKSESPKRVIKSHKSSLEVTEKTLLYIP